MVVAFYNRETNIVMGFLSFGVQLWRCFQKRGLESERGRTLKKTQKEEKNKALDFNVT